MLTFWPDWSVSVKSGVGCGGSSSPPAKPPLPPETVRELVVLCSWLCALPPQAGAANAASRATRRAPRLIVPKIPGGSRVGLPNRLVRPPCQRHGADRPRDLPVRPDDVVELGLDAVRGDDPLAVRRPGGRVAGERTVGDTVRAAEVPELDDLAQGEEGRAVVVAEDRRDALEAWRELRRARERAPVPAFDPLPVDDDRERAVETELRIRDPAVRREDRTVADENLVPDRVRNLVVPRVAGRAARKLGRRAADLEVEPGAPAAAPGDVLPIRAPDDDAEERPVAAELEPRVGEIGNPERLQAVRGRGPKAVGKTRPDGRRPHLAADVLRQRALPPARKADLPYVAGLGVGQRER